MKKILTLGLLALFLIVIGPVLVKQLRPAEQRALVGDSLEADRFEEISFRNGTQSLDLGGMLFVPSGTGPFPAAVVIHGSGTSSRKNRWYLSLTHFLQDSGIVVLLPDKRGSEQSAGDWRQASFEDLATDTVAAIRFLEAQSDVKISGIGVIGMSQGGWIAPIAAKLSPGLSFLVSVVGSTVSTHQQFLYEEDHNLQQLGVLPGISGVLARPATFVARHWLQRDFWNAVGDFDPMTYWQALNVPALALFGAADTNVPSDRSAGLLRGLNKPGITIRVYEGSGHALDDPPGTGDRLFRQDALADIRDFILSSND